MASCFLVYSTDSETKVQTLISIFIIYATGLISILFALPLHMYSESFFHVSDRLEGFSFIAFFLTFFCLGIMNLEEHAAIYAYIPLYILILKPLCILCFDPSGIGFLIKENVYVCCKTWRGREYKAPRGKDDIPYCDQNLPYCLTYCIFMICAVIGILWVFEDQSDKKVQPSRKKKIQLMKIVSTGVFISQIIQNVASYILMYHEGDDDKIKFLICVFIVSITGIITSMFASFMLLNSTEYFHILDCFDGYLLIITYVSFFYVTSPPVFSLKWLVYVYIPFHIYMLKTLYIVFLDPTGIAFLSQETCYVTIKT
ncbi:unnamed protein product [Caenorhabditis brenneri]